ncbi:MAG: hypothetical protein M1828_000482 [Chrysothrix sp. TS-e1954]|nr:MAG: hypothetical protein M1828_000482 [Chrysothrix sp. TS-e1954]
MIILTGSDYVVVLVFLPETYAPRLVYQKKVSEIGIRDDWNWQQRYWASLIRPWVMLFIKPIVGALSIYMALLYGITSLSLLAYAIEYTDQRQWSIAKTALEYVGIAVGMAVPTICSQLLNKAHDHFVRKLCPLKRSFRSR